MKKTKWLLTGLCSLAMVLVMLPMAAYALDDEDGTNNEPLTISIKVDNADTPVQLSSVNADGERFFFLPSGVKEENVTYEFDAETEQFSTMQSSNVCSLFFNSKDPENYGIGYVTKSNKAEGTVRLFNSDFEELYSGKVDAIKGRGNTSWAYSDKKSYQIKLSKKADLLDPNGASQKAKKWILLGNPFDPTLVRNSIVQNFAHELGLESSPEGMPVDLYYDGVYRGTYYLCEKIEIGNGRVEVNDLEKEVEDLNPDVDFDSLASVSGTNSLGFDSKYYEGLNEPENISGGYLLELDSYFYKQESSWISMHNNYIFGVKSPEYMTKQQNEYISDKLEALYRCLSNKGTDPETGKTLFELLDKESAVKYFLTNEWFMNVDTYYSSTFIYKPQDDDKLYLGPVWDADASMGIRDKNRRVEYWYSGGSSNLGGKLFQCTEFRKALQEYYKNEARNIIFDTLVGKKDGTYLQTPANTIDQTKDSAAMNYKIWEINNCVGTFYPLDTYQENLDQMLDWMERRADWFDEEILGDDFVCAGNHSYEEMEGTAIAATCLNEGKEPDGKCSVCGLVKTGDVIPALGHQFGNWQEDADDPEKHKRVCANDPSHIETEDHVWDEGKVTKPSSGIEAGIRTYTCTVCGAVKAEEIDPSQQMGSDGTALGKGASAAAADNAITSMKSDKDPAGSVFQVLKLRSTKQAKNAVTLNWNKAKGADKYVIYGNLCGDANTMKKLETVKTNKYVARKIINDKGNKVNIVKGKYYKFIVVALDKKNNVVSTSKVAHIASAGTKVGNYKRVTVKKKIIRNAKKIKNGKTLKLAPKVVPVSKKKVAKHVGLRYESTNRNIATVSASGVIKGIKKGTCYVSIYAQNGVFKTVKVVVK